MRKTPRKHQARAIAATQKALGESQDPVLNDLSCGFGKSLMAAWYAEWMELNGRNTLVLTMTSDLVAQNSDEYKEMGYAPSIFCSKLGEKTWKASAVFATPQSLWAAIKAGHPISKRIFHLLVIDECHNVNAENDATVYMQIINHYYQLSPMRIVGMTGTAFRGKESIVSPSLLFKKCVYRRTLQQEVADGNLLPYKYGKNDAEAIDYSECKQTRLGNYRAADLEHALEGKGRLTAAIVKEVVVIAKDYMGVFFFAATKDHCNEVAASLPIELTRIITGDTADGDRIKYMQEAKEGKVKYLVSMNCLFTGVNIPHFGIVAWLRPTESLIMFNQGNARVCRTDAANGKTHGLILDYAGNLDRHGDGDDTDLIEYQAQLVEDNEDPNYELDCPVCSTLNLINARRCIGVKKTWNDAHNTLEEKRCDHYFQFVDCPSCEAPNDLTARNCRRCGSEIIDPNKKLSKRAARAEPQWGLVLGMQMSRHEGKKVRGVQKPDTLRIDYLVGNELFDNPMVTEWVSIANNRDRWHKWTLGSKCEDSIRFGSLDDILMSSHMIRAPTRLQFFKPRGEKYLKIVSYDWGDNGNEKSDT